MMRFVFPVLVAFLALAGCATRQPVWQDSQRIINIPGKETAGLAGPVALQRMLAKSARVTVDHGYRYFAVARPQPAANGAVSFLPGGDLTIRLYRDNETRYRAPGIWDAYGLLQGLRAASSAPRD